MAIFLDTLNCISYSCIQRRYMTGNIDDLNVMDIGYYIDNKSSAI